MRLAAHILVRRGMFISLVRFALSAVSLKLRT